MPPKLAMDVLPPPCLAMKNAMVLIGEVSVESSRRCASGALLSAFNEYRRQLQNWWSTALHAQ